MKNFKHSYAPLLAWFSAALCALLLTACQSTSTRIPDADAANLTNLLELIDQRLGVAPLVARAKWNSGAPIDDPARERQILDTVARQATAAGVDPVFARAFFQAQFEAGKVLQRKLHAQWREAAQPRFSDAPDLGRDVRPVLDRLTPQLIALLHKVQPMLRTPGTKTFIEAEGGQRVRGDFDGAARVVALQVLLGD